MKKRVAIAFGLALGLIAILIFAVGWEDVLDAVYQTSPQVYGIAFLSTLGCILCRTFVWHRIMTIIDRPRPYWLIAGVFLTAMFAKYVLPYGQVTSGVGVAAVVSRYYETEYEEGLAGVLSADFLNYIPYYSWGVVAGIGVLTLHSPPLEMGTYVLPLALLIGVVVLFIGFTILRRGVLLTVALAVTSGIKQFITRVFDREITFLDPNNVRARFRGFFTTLELVSRDWPSVAIALVFAHIGWIGLAGALYLTALSVGVSMPISVTFFLVAISKLGFVVPTPGGIGGVEFTLASAMYLISPVGFGTAMAIALLWRISTYWFTLSLGGVIAIMVTIKDPLPPSEP